MKKINVLYEDKHIFVCYKEAGIPVQTKNIRQIDLERMILNELSDRGERAEIFVVHRLDQPVEGVMVFAKTKQAAAALSSQFQKKQLSKEYLAVVDGCFESIEVHLENYLLRDAKTNLSKIVKEGTQGSKLAQLDLSVLAEKEGKQLIIVHLHTGRHHQIRVQLSGAGHPIVGDKKYNLNYVNQKGFVQTALCAYRLSFLHPASGKSMDFCIKPCSGEFRQFGNELERL